MSGPYQNVPLPRHLLGVPPNYRQKPRKEPKTYVEESDEMRFSAPPKMVFKKPRAAPPPPPSPMSAPTVTQPKSKFDTTGSSDSSNDQPFAYTRDRLLGAVEKVRSGMLLARASPYKQEGMSRINYLFSSNKNKIYSKAFKLRLHYKLHRKHRSINRCWKHRNHCYDSVDPLPFALPKTLKFSMKIIKIR